MKRPKMMLALLEEKKDGHDRGSSTYAARRKVNAPGKIDEKTRNYPADLFAYKLFSKEITTKIEDYVAKLKIA